MAELSSLLTRLGYVEPKTLLQSGNAVIGVHGTLTAAGMATLEQRIQHELKHALDVESDVFVRTAKAWAALIDSNPFVDEAVSDPGHLVAVVMNAVPAAAAVTSLQAAVKGREVVRHIDRQLYISYPDGIGRSALTGSVIERTLGVRGTARNWNTVRKLSELLEV